MTPALAMETPRPFPHVAGRSKRVKAEPTKLTELAARVMCASGGFTTKRAPARSPSGLFAGLVVFLLAAGTLAIGATPRPDGLETAGIAGPQLAVSDDMLSLGIGEFTAASAEPEEQLDAQDRFEIARMFRLTAAANQALAPAAGPQAAR